MNPTQIHLAHMFWTRLFFIVHTLVCHWPISFSIGWIISLGGLTKLLFLWSCFIPVLYLLYLKWLRTQCVITDFSSISFCRLKQMAVVMFIKHSTGQCRNKDVVTFMSSSLQIRHLSHDAQNTPHVYTHWVNSDHQKMHQIFRLRRICFNAFSCQRN